MPSAGARGLRQYTRAGSAAHLAARTVLKENSRNLTRPDRCHRITAGYVDATGG